MKHTKPAAALLLGIFLSACGKDTAPDVAALDRVPADSAYVFANLEPLPENVTDANLTRAARIWQPMAEHFEQMLAEAEDVDPAAAETVTALFNKLAEMESGDAVREQTGIEPAGTAVIYGLELFPVLDIAVHDQTAADAFIAEIAGTLSARRGSADVAGNEVQWLSFADAPIAIYYRVGEQRLTVALLPIVEQDDFLARVFGEQLPEDTISTADLRTLNNKHGFEPYGSGYFDLLAGFDQIVGENTFIGEQARAAAGNDPLFAEPACQREIRGLLSQAPRLVAGYTAVDVDEIASKAVWLLDQKLVEDLRPIASGAAIGSDPEAPFSMGLAFNLGSLRNLVSSRMQAVVDQPFECSELQDLNDSARQAVEQMNQPIPPLVGNLKGLRVILSSIEQTDGPVPVKGQGSMALFIDNPQMVIAMAQGFVPALASLDLKPGGDPQQIPAAMIPIDIGKAFLAASDQAIGLAVGEDQVEDMNKLINASGNNDANLLMTTGLDYEFYTSQLEGFADTMIKANDATNQEEAAKAREMMKSMSGIYAELGYIFVTTGINDHGLVFESTQRFDSE